MQIKSERPSAICLLQSTISLFALTATLGCTGTTDQPLLNRFFAASRLRDRTALQQVATVIFEPRTHGIITHFTITAVGSEQRVKSTRDGADLVMKEVTISAPVRLPSGHTQRKTFIITLQRGIVKGHDVTGRWMITGIKEGPAAASTSKASSVFLPPLRSRQPNCRPG